MCANSSASAYFFISALSVKVKLFFNIGSNGGYEALSVLNAVGSFKSNLFLITSSTLAEDKDMGATVQGEIAGWQGNKLDLRIDLILATHKLKVKSSKVIFNGHYKEVVSDHYGVEVVLTLTP